MPDDFNACEASAVPSYVQLVPKAGTAYSYAVDLCEAKVYRRERYDPKSHGTMWSYAYRNATRHEMTTGVAEEINPPRVRTRPPFTASGDNRKYQRRALPRQPAT